MTYPLLENAPAHDSPEFIDYLRSNNVVVFENPQWIVIENCKYHTKERGWYTAFHKPYKIDFKDGTQESWTEWHEDIDILWYHENWGDWEWRKKAANKQTVKRFHIHLIEPKD